MAIISSDNGLSSTRYQDITYTNDVLLSRTNSS